MARQETSRCKDYEIPKRSDTGLMWRTKMPLAHNKQDVDNFIVFGVVNTYLWRHPETGPELREFVPLCLRFNSAHVGDRRTWDKWVIECIATDRGHTYRTYPLDEIEPR